MANLFKKLIKKREVTCDLARCTLCGTCAAICPRRAINTDGSTWQIDHDACVHCSRCIRVCPEKALQMVKK